MSRVRVSSPAPLFHLCKGPTANASEASSPIWCIFRVPSSPVLPFRNLRRSVGTTGFAAVKSRRYGHSSVADLYTNFRLYRLSVIMIITVFLKPRIADERDSQLLELRRPPFIWWGVYSSFCRDFNLSRGNLVSKNAPKKRAFQDLARTATQNLARAATRILSPAR
jgi:hypothetical protein